MIQKKSPQPSNLYTIERFKDENEESESYLNAIIANIQAGRRAGIGD